MQAFKNVSDVTMIVYEGIPIMQYALYH